ncbi:RNA-guided pseudouridylation complex pseudouridine synthase subunit Cbf5 [Candidatus Pacearchaeota archaeon]|nr:RNA-guided pseudouridylation complex pseudouridine synthase subunit Cbf5 [Candidatus Pacearchaeota archaeon]
MEKTIQELLNFSIINIDKPSGPTSFGVDVIVKKMLGLNKTSHFGTLDPQVTGVLPIALGRACRLSDYFMHKNKKYVGIMRVHQEISREKLEEEISKFIGKIMQLPPVKSRVKREIREREIFSFKILENDGKDFLFETEVQAGTYIRKLISDLGNNIGGAHMLELRRTQAGIFSEEKIINMYEFEKAVSDWKNGNDEKLRKILIPAEKALEKVLTCVQIKQNMIKQLLTGKPIHKGEIKLLGEEKFAVFSQDKFIGIYRKVNEKDIIARAEFVFN